MKKEKKTYTEEEKKSLPLYTIGVVAELLGTTDQTLRLYEKHGLIKPSRRNKNRYYSENDIKWLQCLRELIHVRKISIEGIKNSSSMLRAGNSHYVRRREGRIVQHL